MANEIIDRYAVGAAVARMHLDTEFRKMLADEPQFQDAEGHTIVLSLGADDFVTEAFELISTFEHPVIIATILDAASIFWIRMQRGTRADLEVSTLHRNTTIRDWAALMQMSPGQGFQLDSVEASTSSASIQQLALSR